MLTVQVTVMEELELPTDAVASTLVKPYRLLIAGIVSQLLLINLLTGQHYPDELTSKSAERRSINNR